MTALLLFALLAVNTVNVVLIVQCWQISNENDDIIAEIGEALDRIEAAK